ncbi:MAG: 2-hydroxyacyl-CoA dehydratase subunit D, partial [Dehalococcoidia bacterium]
MYETRPIECWQRAKELRMKQWQDIVTAREKNRLLVSGMVNGAAPLAMGLGDDVEYMASEPLSASTLADASFSMQCQEALEARGFARDLCGYMRSYMGPAFINRFPLGGDFPRPDFIFERRWCDTQAKGFQVVAEYLGVPFHCVDFPVGPGSGERFDLKVDYVASQYQRAIEWMEKVTGREWDYDRFLVALQNEITSRTLWAQIVDLNRAVPAPLDQKSMYALFAVTAMMPWKQESVEFHRALLDEVRYRAEHQIAALGAERFRVLHEALPPWHYLKLFRILEAYGAACIGSHHCILIPGDFREVGDDLVPAQPPQELFTGFRNLEEALRFYARWYLESPMDAFYVSAQRRSDLILKIAKNWKADGAILPVNRGCTFGGMGLLETKLAL